MRRFAGCCRFIWNKALALEKETYEQGGKRHGYNNLAGLLWDWKNKAILDQGWFEFRRQLTYKLAWNGGKLIVVPPQYTSQTCSHCGHIDKANRKTQAQFACTACGFEANADYSVAERCCRCP